METKIKNEGLQYPKEVEAALAAKAAGPIPNLEEAYESGVSDLDPHSYGSIQHNKYICKALSSEEALSRLPSPGEIIRVWFARDEVIFSKEGEPLRRNLSAYSSYRGGANTGDVCPYCGYDNQPPGQKESSRQGYDCGHCGGN